MLWKQMFLGYSQSMEELPKQQRHAKRRKLLILVMMISHFYIRQDLKTSNNKKCEDHVLETNVSGILSEHGRAAETATKCKRKEMIYISDNYFSCLCPPERENTEKD